MPTRETKSDASSRGLRTVVQGLVSVALVAVAGVVADQVTPGAVVDWVALGGAVATAAGTAIAAYVHRLLDGDPPQGEHARGAHAAEDGR